MVGEIHSDDPHDLLVPYAKKVSVPIGDVNSYPLTPDYILTESLLRKYIKVKGKKMNPDEAVSLIRNACDPSDLLSTHFPGDLALVYGPDAAGEVVA